MTRLQQKIALAMKSDEGVPKAKVLGLHSANKLPQSGTLPTERDNGKGAECVGGGSIAQRSGTITETSLTMTTMIISKITATIMLSNFNSGSHKTHFALMEWNG